MESFGVTQPPQVQLGVAVAPKDSDRRAGKETRLESAVDPAVHVHTSAAGSVSFNQLLNFLLPNRAEGDEDS